MRTEVGSAAPRGTAWTAPSGGGLPVTERARWPGGLSSGETPSSDRPPAACVHGLQLQRPPGICYSKCSVNCECDPFSGTVTPQPRGSHRAPPRAGRPGDSGVPGAVPARDVTSLCKDDVAFMTIRTEANALGDVPLPGPRAAGTQPPRRACVRRSGACLPQRTAEPVARTLT